MTDVTLLGVMTGTSCDGLDASAVCFSGDSFTVLWNRSAPYPRTLRSRVLALQADGSRHALRELLALHRDLGDWYGSILARWPLRKIDAIANHGQTVAHFPPKSTLQLGEATAIAHATGLSVVSDFRWGDLVSGGQGAPLVPAFHMDLGKRVQQDEPGLAIHNLGGISNLTYLRPARPPLAWDTGPANLWMDAIMRHRSKGRIHFDQGGRLAARGESHPSIVERLLKKPYFKLQPPKSTGRDDFSEREAITATARLSIEDALATVTTATARSIARSYDRFILSRGLPLSRILVCGGGARNSTLLQEIRRELLELGWLVTLDDTRSIGIDPQHMESSAFAFLGRRALLGQSLGGHWTGGSPSAPSAKLTPGKNWPSLLAKLAHLTG